MPTPATELETTLSRGVIWILAVACGVSVANVYFPQAISPLIASQLHTSLAAAALVATAAQLGYAAGLFLLVPLGDRVAQRRLVVVLLMATAAGLAAAGAAPDLWYRRSCSRWPPGWSLTISAAR
jgi:predicted MFS family arabinose efflux permease